MNFADLDDNLASAFPNKSRPYAELGDAPRAAPEKQKFPCSRCAGTGKFTGFRINVDSNECYTCSGRGFTLIAPDKLKARNAKRKATIAAKRMNGIADFREAHPDLYKAMLENQWSSFIADLVQQLNERGSLSSNQIEAVKRAIARIEEKRAERQAEHKAEREAKSGEVDVSAIRALFDTASGNGLKKPKFRVEKMDLALAPATGRNPNAIYVRFEGEYAGKITGTRFEASREAPSETLDILRNIAADPRGMAIAYGRKTGICCCCGRELTDPVSVENGIGPICEANWGL